MLRVSLRRVTVTTVIVLLIVSSVGPWNGSATSPAEIGSCGTINEAGTYVLAGDVRGGSRFTNPCLVVTASDVAIRGEGNAVSSLVTRGDSIENVSVTNVGKASFLELVNVSDGQITSVGGQVRVFESQDVQVSDSRLSSAFVRSSENVTVADNTVVNGTVTLFFTDNSTVTRNQPAPGAYATYNVEYSDNNALINNVARSGGEYPEQGGFHFAYGSTENHIANNTVSASDGVSIDIFDPYGFTFSSSGSNRLVNNTVNLREDVAYLASGSVNTVVNLTLADGTNATFSGDNIEVNATAETPAPPTEYGTLGYYVEAKSVEPSGQESWFTPTVSYDETSVSKINESTLRFWQYGDDVYAPIGKLENASPTVDSEAVEDTNWQPIAGINNIGGVNGVDPDRNVVFANITNLGAENRLVFRDQVTHGTNVTVEAVSLPRPGFVVVTDEQGEIRGVSEYLSAGVHDDVLIQLSDPLNSDTTLAAVAQTDSNGNRQYDASIIREECAFSGPNGTTLRDEASGDLVRSDLNPAITSIERPTENTLSVSATLPKGGFVVVSGPDPLGDVGERPTAGASAYLQPGSHQNVTVELADYLEGMARNSSDGTVEVDVYLIEDDGDRELDWSYNFPGEDWPYETDDGFVVERLALSYEDGGGNETVMED